MQYVVGKGKNMNKKVPLGITISLIAIACAVTFVLTTSYSLDLYNQKVESVKEREEMYQKLSEIDGIVRANYFGEMADDNILDAISSGYIDVLNDKWASYLTAQQYTEENQKHSGTTVGLGITVAPDESGYILIKEVKSDSPASKAGIKAGELIIAINGTTINTDNYAQSIKSIAGETGTSINFTTRSNGNDKDVKLTREQIEVQSVKSKMLENTSIGYVQITDFNSKTTEQFKNQVNSLEERGASAYIFDVRNNSGGMLEPTLDILDFILPEGPIATAEYKNNRIETLKESDNSQISQPIIVLTNSRTASAAELFASALKDFDKAQVVGSVTYGKGVMQETFVLRDGSAIKFTVAKFQTPKTPNFDGVGLKPNYEVLLAKDMPEDLAMLDERSDPQMAKALEILSTKVS